MAKLTAGATYTDQELLDLFREALAKVSVEGRSFTIRNRTYTSNDLAEIREMIAWLEKRIDNADSGLPSNPVRLSRAS